MRDLKYFTMHFSKKKEKYKEPIINLNEIDILFQKLKQGI